MKAVALASAAAVAAVLFRLITKRGTTRSVAVIQKGSSLRSPSPDTVSVLSFNVLADAYSKPQRHKYVNPRYLAWQHRWDLIHQELAATAADIICLQEVDSARSAATQMLWRQ